MVVTAVKDEAEFNKIVKDTKNTLIVIDFFATWCGPCRAIAPKIEQFSKTYPEVVFIKVDVDDVSEVAKKCDISAMPTFHLMKNGDKVGELVGADADELEKLIQQHK
ncbi:uncharacterized protein LOC132758317 [Ruditapes philippinarum]|uniref:uncharacterized protein LOC132758317 n=1 Tax=Ruditapes philippinarum TaxID=129788 RepID=UPI00295C0DBB|nr:uncharacterized protein LOC132758317 [Ruditapes philippinarum]